MKKGINIFLTVMLSIIVLFLLIETIFGKKNMGDLNVSLFGSDSIEKLQGIGILFLGIVKFSMFLFVFLMMVLIPMISYRVFRSTDSDFEFVKEWGKLILIVLGGISIFAIAGVQLRGLKEFDDKPTEVRIVEQSRTTPKPSENPKDLGGLCFYYNDSINDWALTSGPDYIKKKKKSSHLLYQGKSETKYYRKNSFGNWLEVNKIEFYLCKDKGVQTLEHTPIPEIKYFLFSDNKWQKINKEEFFKYIELDSIVRYE